MTRARSATARSGRRPPATAEDFVVVPRRTLADLAARIEDIEDALAARQAIESYDPRRSFPAAVADRVVDGENAVRVCREHRGMTRGELAAKSGVSPSYLAEIETGKKPGSAAALKKLARALAVPLDLLVP